MKVFGKEPAFWVGVLEAVVLAAVAFGVDQELGVIVTAIVVAIGGVLAAWTVKERLLAALLAVARALAALIVYLGFDLSDAQIASVMAVLSVTLGGWLRDHTEPAETPLSASTFPPEVAEDDFEDVDMLADSMVAEDAEGLEDDLAFDEEVIEPDSSAPKG